MKIYLSIIFSFFSFSFLCGQGNLVPNSGFEFGSEYISSQVGEKVYNWVLPKPPIYYLSTDPVGTSDWYCSSILSHSGTAHIGALVQSEFAHYLRVEYATTKLIDPLVEGKTYFYKYFVRAVAHEGDKVGLGFTMERPIQKWQWHVIDIGQILKNYTVFNPADGWVEIKGTFVAEKDYKWITIGCFAEDFISFKSSQRYYYDDISVSEFCPQQMLIENHNYEFKESAFEARNISAGYDVDASQSNGQVLVEANADIIYKAEAEVTLEPGFDTELGAEFLAHIAPCGRNCNYLPVLDFNEIIEVCTPQKVPIGMTYLPQNVSFEWSAVPESAMGYLINANSTNPFFDTPHNACGQFMYTLKVWNECEEVATRNVCVKYNTSGIHIPLQFENLIQNNFAISFDVVVGSCTDDIVVQVFSSQNNFTSAVFSKKYRTGVDFQCCTLHWSSDCEYLSPCYNYKIKVVSTDICTQDITIEQVEWVRDSEINALFLPNVVTANNDNSNDCLEFVVSGAEEYLIKVYNNWGNLLIYTDGQVQDTICAWQPAPYQFATGVYYWVASFSNSCGNEISKQGCFSLINGSTGKIFSKEFERKGINSEDSFVVLPNPTKNELTLIFAFEENAELLLFDIQGKEILRIEKNKEIALPLNGLAAGIYFIKIRTQTNLFTKKILVL